MASDTGTGPAAGRRVAQNSRRRLLFVAYVIGLFSVFYFYVLLRIRPELFYHQNSVVFLLDWHFFVPFLDHPGGPVDYVSAFLSPLLAHNWLGALVLTLLTALICLATRQFITACTGAGSQIVFLIPAVLILAVLGKYIHPVRLCVGLLVALVFANAYVRMASRHAVVRLVVFVIGSALAYYITAGLYVVAACLCGLFELGVKRRRFFGAFYLLCAAGFPLEVGVRVFDVSIENAYRGLTLTRWEHWLATPSSVPISTTTQAVLLLFFPIAAIFLITWVGITRAGAGDPDAQAHREPAADVAAASNRSISRAHWAVPAVTLLALGIVVDLALFDAPEKCLLQMALSAEDRRWADVLYYAQRLPPSIEGKTDARTAAEVDRALYFRGNLLDQMFSFPQGLFSSSLALVFDDPMTMATMTPRQCSDILFDLGRINESEHMAYEALETYGDRPGLLKRLFYVNVLKGEPEAARFLALLEHSLLHRRWARDCRRQLDADPTLSSVSVIAMQRNLMVTRDSVNDLAQLETMLLGLLERNRQNRMAFEYLMAHYLLTQQLEKLAKNLHRFDDFDYQRFPRHYEEALVIYLASHGSQDIDLGEREIRWQTWLRFRRFVETLHRFPEDTPTGSVALELYPDFGDTYFFCHMFGHNQPNEQQRLSE